MPQEPTPDLAPGIQPPEAAPLRIAAAAVLRQGPDGMEVLIARRNAEAIRGGLWEYPGGKVMPGESAAEAAARELLEETGLAVDASSGTVVARSSHEDAGLARERAIVIELVAFRGPCGADPKPLAAAECRWESVERLDDHAWPAANVPLNAALRAFVRSAGA
jgi:8-oxo-dGTP diphosphatase